MHVPGTELNGPLGVRQECLYPRDFHHPAKRNPRYRLRHCLAGPSLPQPAAADPTVAVGHRHACGRRRRPVAAERRRGAGGVPGTPSHRQRHAPLPLSAGYAAQPPLVPALAGLRALRRGGERGRPGKCRWGGRMRRCHAVAAAAAAAGAAASTAAAQAATAAAARKARRCRGVPAHQPWRQRRLWEQRGALLPAGVAIVVAFRIATAAAAATL